MLVSFRQQCHVYEEGGGGGGGNFPRKNNYRLILSFIRQPCPYKFPSVLMTVIRAADPTRLVTSEQQCKAF